MCSLRFENILLTIEGVRFASISKKTPLSKLSFAFVSLALPLLTKTVWFSYTCFQTNKKAKISFKKQTQTTRKSQMKDVHLDVASVTCMFIVHADTSNLMLKHRQQKSWNKNIKVQTQKIVIIAGQLTVNSIPYRIAQQYTLRSIQRVTPLL